MEKTFNTADGKAVKVVLYNDMFEGNATFFKYSVLEYTNDRVKFKILNSPATTKSGGCPIAKIISEGTTAYIGSDRGVEMYGDNIMFVFGSETEPEDIVLECPVYMFNLFQLAMLYWNVSVIRHTSKKMTQRCVMCGEIKTENINLGDVQNKFYLRKYSCCPIPATIDIVVTPTLNHTGGDRGKVFTFSCHPYFRDQLSDALSVSTLYDLYQAIRSYCSSTTRVKIRIQNRCIHCGEIQTPEYIGIEPFFEYQGMMPACETCRANMDVCFECGATGHGYQQWGDSKLCHRCCAVSTCYLCSIDTPADLAEPVSTGSSLNAPVSEVAGVPTRRVTRQHAHGGTTAHNLCYSCHTEIQANGWDAARLIPELNYSYKISPTELEVMTKTGKKPLVDTKEPVAAVEWEFPFSIEGCKTKLRDRAIWHFQETCKQHGHPELFIAKHDGSLPSFATEFVSKCPSTLDMWQELYRSGIFDKLIKFMDLRYVQQNSTNTGGHIHISRSSFTPTQVAKFIRFIYSNLQLMQEICERPDAHYYSSNMRNQHPLIFAHNATAVSADKYSLVRATSNPLYQHKGFDAGTLEVRAFKTPTSAFSMIKNIEFMFALREYCVSVSGVDFIKSTAFSEFVKDHMKTYPVLAEKLYSVSGKTFHINQMPGAHWTSIMRERHQYAHKEHLGRLGIGARAMHPSGFSGGAWECTHCDGEYNTYDGDAYPTAINGRYYCHECAYSCYSCGRVGIYDQAYTHHYELYCEECHYTNFVECCECGEWEHIDSTGLTASGRRLCDYCQDNAAGWVFCDSHEHWTDYACCENTADFFAEDGE